LVPPTKSYDPFLWAAFIVHHSSDNFNLGTAVRNGWFTIFYKPFFYVWIVIIGFPPEMLVVCMGIEALAVSTAHTICKKLGFIEISEYSHHASSTPRTEY
jgi:sterol desaturase/sphingolipid hydroxylase (fatty acid hydroxylase superfamily)